MLLAADGGHGAVVEMLLRAGPPFHLLPHWGPEFCTAVSDAITLTVGHRGEVLSFGGF